MKAGLKPSDRRGRCVDPQDAAGRLLDAVSAGEDFTPWLADDVHVRSDTVDTLSGQEWMAWLRERLAAPHRRFVPGETVMKRNLVFAWWAIEGIDGVEEQGTWILSFDRDGRVVEWQEFRG